MQVTIAQLVAIVAPFASHQFDGLRTLKIEKTLKKDRQTGHAFNGSLIVMGHYNALIGADYETAVNNRRKAEGLDADFVAGSLPWGQWLEGSKTVITHKGGFYLRQTHNLKVKKRYMLDGVLTDKKDLPDVLPASGPYGASQGLAEAVAVTTHDLENVLSLQFNGELYELIGNRARELANA